MGKKFFIIDGNSYIHRAYHAIRGLKNSDGFPTNAVYGFTNMLMKIMEESPEYIAVVFDAAKKSFRNNIYPEYKANRPPMDEELAVQIPYIKKLVNAFNIPVIVEEDVEADDVIATLTNLFGDKFDIVIISSDKDLMQLLSSNVIMWDTLKNVKYSPESVKDKFGVKKDFIIDYLSLVGDSSDNIPGVKGIGPKTAVKLIEKFGTIENIYENLENISHKKTRQLLEAGKDNAFLSKSLVRLKNNLKLSLDNESLKFKSYNLKELESLFKELEFTSLLKKFNLKAEFPEYEYKFTDEFPASVAVAGIVKSFQEGFFSETTAALTSDGKNVYFADNFNDFKKFPKIKFITWEYKEFLKNFEHVSVSDFEDVSLLAYVFEPEQKNTLENIAKNYCKKNIKSLEDYKKKKNEKISFAKLSAKDKRKFLSERSCAIFHSYEYFMKNMDDSLKNLYFTMEKPLVKVLFKMEKKGVFIDTKILKELDRELTEELKQLTNEIYNIAEEEFNINSPKQLREILFEKMGLEIVKKTKTGASTDNEVLEILSGTHVLPRYILEYREKTKIKSTYLEGIINLVNEKTGRIHPTFNQTVTATGRLSCTNPNIQNIPIRTEYGDKIRKAFSAPKGKLLVSLDYSQIELRIMAHFSNDSELVSAFEKGLDVHTLTASKIYGVKIEDVTPQMRRDGKTVNFAIIYGISAFGLAKSLKVTRNKAKIFIENYFNEYKGVKNFIEKMVTHAKEHGYVETLFKRRRFIKGIKSRNHQEKEFAKRIAVNTPIQGTAADIIKLAMIELSEMEKNFNANAVMQIHDELIFEVNEKHAEKFSVHAKEIMENIAPALNVPLTVDIGIGKNWFEAH